jgi:hypothetical protein
VLGIWLLSGDVVCEHRLYLVDVDTLTELLGDRRRVPESQIFSSASRSKVPAVSTLKCVMLR